MALSWPGLGLFLPELSLRFVKGNRMFTGLTCFWVELGIDVTELALLATDLTAFFAKVTNFLNQDYIINYVTLCHVFILLIPLNGLAKFEYILEHFVVLKFEFF